MKLLQKDLAKYREQLLKKQNGLCAICGLPIVGKGKSALDHDHRYPYTVRAVIHRDCNIVLGKIENSQLRTGMPKEQLLQMVKGLYNYLSTNYEDNPVHPKELFRVFETEKQTDFTKKELNRLNKARGKLKTDSAKQRYSETIQTLSERLKELNKNLKEENLIMAWKPEDGV